MSALCSLTVFADAQDSIWQKPLAEVKMENVPLKDAIQSLVELYQKQYPRDNRVAGYLVLDAEKNSTTISVNFKNIPMGEACQMMASSIGWNYVIHDRALSFAPMGSGYFTNTTRVFSVSDQIVKSLELDKADNLEAVLASIKAMNVRTNSFEEKKIFTANEGTYLIITGPREELDILAGLWQLLERGLSIPSPKK